MKVDKTILVKKKEYKAHKNFATTVTSPCDRSNKLSDKLPQIKNSNNCTRSINVFGPYTKPPLVNYKTRSIDGLGKRRTLRTSQFRRGSTNRIAMQS